MRKLFGFTVLVLLAAACTSTTTATQTQTITASPSYTYSPTATLAPADGVETQTPTAVAAPAPGTTFNNPIPVGQAGVATNWKVSVAGFSSNATAAIMQENMFNSKPHSGDKFVMVTVKVANQSTAARDPFYGLDFALVTSDGKVISGDSGNAYWNVIPHQLTDVGKVPAGLNATGNVAFDVKLDTSVVAIYVSASGNKGTFLSLK